jgi:hypothetical protein
MDCDHSKHGIWFGGGFGGEEAAAIDVILDQREHLTPRAEAKLDARGTPHSEAIDKRVLAFPEPRRTVTAITPGSQPSSRLVCGRQPLDAHQVRFAQSPALGREVSDEYTVPLCRGHHWVVHRCGNETVWWLKGIQWSKLGNCG